MGRGPNKALQLVVLGFLDREPTHPYGLVASLKGLGAESWMRLNPSAIYYTVERLAEAGYVRASARLEGEGRPDRTVYEITDEGRALLPGLVRERFTALIPMHPPMYPALLFAESLPPAELTRALDDRILMLEGVIEMLEGHLSYDRAFSRTLRQLLKHALALNRAEVKWCAEFKQELAQPDDG